MIETKIEMVGISVERISCKKIYTINTTSKIASSNVTITSCMDAYRKRFVSLSVTNSIPFGSPRLISSSVASISLIISAAFEPAV